VQARGEERCRAIPGSVVGTHESEHGCGVERCRVHHPPPEHQRFGRITNLLGGACKVLERLTMECSQPRALAFHPLLELRST